MRTEHRDVYSTIAGTRTKVAEVDVQVYQTLDEVIAFAKKSQKAEAEIILTINRMKITDAMNTARADATREVKPETVIGRAIKQDPALLLKMAEFLKSQGIELPSIPEVKVGSVVGKKEVK